MGIRKSFLRTVGVAVALTCAASANATVFNVGPPGSNFFLTNGSTPTSPSISAFFQNSFAVGGVETGFDDTFQFTIPQDGFGSGSATTSFVVESNRLKITDVIFNGTSYASQLLANNFTGVNISGVPITNGVLNTIQVIGTVTGSNGYTGTATFAASAIPEPASWAMMLVGFGAIGAASRRRRVRTSVSFS